MTLFRPFAANLKVNCGEITIVHTYCEMMQNAVNIYCSYNNCQTSALKSILSKIKAKKVMTKMYKELFGSTEQGK